MVGLSECKKIFEDMYNHLHTIPACDRQTDILPRHSLRYAYASRSKNGTHWSNYERPYLCLKSESLWADMGGLAWDLCTYQAAFTNAWTFFRFITFVSVYF